ncbi:MAG: hypothetical protein DWH91_13145 [Planctomycetota bacterium]|nr:MAG: hypothetical protein DWH91_13145 [Planctomycetota bacterium]
MKEVWTTLVMATLIAWIQGLSAQEVDLSSLPQRTRESAFLELRVRESTENGLVRMVLITTFRTDDSLATLFNPLGRYPWGRPYYIVLTDSSYKILHTVTRNSLGMTVPQCSDHWGPMWRHSVSGRSFWTLSPDTAPGRLGKDQRPSHDLADLPVVPAGRYYLILLATKRIEFRSPEENGSFESQQRWLKEWNDPSLDEPAFASPPAIVEVDAQGVYHPIVPEGVDTQFSAVESEYRVDTKGDLSVTTRFVNPTDAMLAIRNFNIYEKADQPTRVVVSREDGQPFDRFTRLWGGSGRFRRIVSDSVTMPRDCVVGGTEPYSGSLPPGKYQVTTEINESIYANKLFLFGEKQTPEGGKWPVAFRSRTTTITVPEKAP